MAIAYLFLVVEKGEDNPLVARIVISAIGIGAVGGLWDGIWKFVKGNLMIVGGVVQVISCLMLIALGVWIWMGGKDDSTEK
ncbi:MAG: hypothetical protein F6K31_23420 [Symploca sp. SIO2G7]|nr:hypothetical protein [Symploca sp. SIO2G7]